MAEFKTLQFLNTATGQAEKVRVLQNETAQGWRVVSETVVPGKFNGEKACCFFIICTPCAFLAGNKDDVITVTLERDNTATPTIPSEEAPHLSFDRKKWQALVQYDPDIAKAATQLQPLGPRWLDEFAAAYMTLNDKSYIPNIVANIESRAQQAKFDEPRLAAEAARKAEAARQAQAALEQQQREAEASDKIVYLVIGGVVAVVILAMMLS